MVKLIAAAVWALAILNSSCQAQPRRAAPAREPLFSLAPGPPTGVGGRPNDIALADFNRDGKLDLVTCNEGDAVTVWLGNGRAGFTPAPGSPFKAAAHLVAAGDVNGDGKPDLALTHHDSYDVAVLLGAGDGSFAPAPGSPFAAHQGSRPHNHGLTLADLNSDGRLDLITSNQDDNSVSVLLGDGRGGFAPSPGSPFAVGHAPYPHAAADVNVRANSVTVLLGDGRGGFANAPNSPHAVATRPYYVAVGDVNGDGRPDLVATHDDISLITTLLGDGRGGFAAAPASPFDLGRRAYKVIAADLNGDARADLVVSTMANESVAVLLSDARGGYTHADGSPYAAGSNPRVAFGDVNGDGRPDIVAANSQSAGISVFLHR
jgi:hypothetical protein